MEPLGVCAGCKDWVHPACLVTTTPKPDGIKVVYHHDCGHLGKYTWEPERFMAYFQRFKDARAVSNFTLKRTYDPELVGRTVQGFRIDLDAVETVADMSLYWDAQPSAEVPVEEGRR